MSDAIAGAGVGWPLVGLAALGAFHGINPGMGWLFAVALGMQEQRRSAMWRALAALSAGHALAITAALIAAVLSRGVVSDAVIRAVVTALLIGMGTARLVRSRHPRVGSMRIGFGGLVGWSFLMASAHGAGLMVLPIVLDAPVHASAGHANHVLAAAGNGALWVVTATTVHAAAYLVVTALIAWVVYEKVGLALLRRAWINLDAIWGIALIIAGLVALVAS